MDRPRSRMLRTLSVLALTMLTAGVTQLAVSTSAFADPDGSDLTRLRRCESGGRYHLNTGNGYYGAYQFNLRTWHAVGGQGYPQWASPQEQDYRALYLYRMRGWHPWPACSRKLHLINDDDAASGDVPTFTDLLALQG